MKDLANLRFIKFKGLLFFLIGLASAVLLMLESPTLKTGSILALCVWSFCRAYYFAFYVIEHYADPGYRFAGLWSFLVYLVRKERAR